MDKFWGCPECFKADVAKDRAWMYTLDLMSGDESWTAVPQCADRKVHDIGTCPLLDCCECDEISARFQRTGRYINRLPPPPMQSLPLRTDSPHVTGAGRVPCPAFTEDNTTKEENMNLTDSSHYNPQAIADAAAEVEADRRASEAAEILQRVQDYGDDKYAVNTVFRFDKNLVTRNGAYSNDTPLKKSTRTYTYAVLKASDGRFYGSGVQFDDWSRLVFWLVAEGSPVEKSDVEIFPPAKFTASGDSAA